MKQHLLTPVAALAISIASVNAVHGAIVVTVWDPVGLEIPDAPVSGIGTTVSDTRLVSSYLEDLRELKVWLKFSGSDGAGGVGTMWNGDLLVTLTHESGASVVLLNRVGTDATHPFGASGSGLDVTLDAGALDDVHGAGGGVITGTYQPDGRSEDPFTVTAESARDANFQQLLETLAHNSPNGLWTLSVTDNDSGNLARLDGWGMTMSGVPEPEAYAGIAAASLAAFGFLRRLRRKPPVA